MGGIPDRFNDLAVRINQEQGITAESKANLSQLIEQIVDVVFKNKGNEPLDFKEFKAILVVKSPLAPMSERVSHLRNRVFLEGNLLERRDWISRAFRSGNPAELDSLLSIITPEEIRHAYSFAKEEIVYDLVASGKPYALEKLKPLIPELYLGEMDAELFKAALLSGNKEMCHLTYASIRPNLNKLKINESDRVVLDQAFALGMMQKGSLEFLLETFPREKLLQFFKAPNPLWIFIYSHHEMQRAPQEIVAKILQNTPHFKSLSMDEGCKLILTHLNEPKYEVEAAELLLELDKECPIKEELLEKIADSPDRYFNALLSSPLVSSYIVEKDPSKFLDFVRQLTQKQIDVCCTQQVEHDEQISSAEDLILRAHQHYFVSPLSDEDRDNLYALIADLLKNIPLLTLSLFTRLEPDLMRSFTPFMNDAQLRACLPFLPKEATLTLIKNFPDPAKQAQLIKLIPLSLKKELLKSYLFFRPSFLRLSSSPADIAQMNNLIQSFKRVEIAFRTGEVDDELLTKLNTKVKAAEEITALYIDSARQMETPNPLPEEFYDAITGELMRNPILLPKPENTYVDQTTFERLFTKNGENRFNPYTRTEFPESDYILDEDLKKRINEWDSGEI